MTQPTERRFVMEPRLDAEVETLNDAIDLKVNLTDPRLTDERTPLDNSVTSAKIVNGTIVNADIADATITSAKLAGVDGNTTVVQIKRNTEANWTSTNPTLAAGEIGFETDTGLSKVGNGSSAWTSLAYTASSTMKQVVKAGESLTRGQAVYASGSDGTYLVVSKASNATEATSSKTLGLINQDLASGATGRLVTEGLLNGVNTSTATAGDPVWLGTSGNLLFGLSAKPVAPAHLVFIGIVTVANTSGTIYVRPQNGFELNELHNVYINPATLVDGNVLKYDEASELWINGVGGGGASVTVSDTAPATPEADALWYDSTDGTLYVYYEDVNGSQWVQVQANSALTAGIESRVGALESQAIAMGAMSPNYLINADFGINQRGLTSTTSTGYGFDRWATYNSGGTTYSAQTFTPGAAPVAGYEGINYARLVTSGQSGTSAYTQFAQKIEDVRTIAGKTVTVSFWAKAASGTPKVSLELQQNFGSGGSPSSSVETYAGQVTLSTSWARYSITVSVPSISGKTIGTTANTSFTQMSLWTSAGTDFNSRAGSIGIQSNTFDFWGVQLELGTTATAFRRNAPSVQAELAACQRYYQRMSSNATSTWTVFGMGNWGSSTSMRPIIQLKTTMRTSPTSVEFSNIGAGINGVSIYGITSMTIETTQCTPDTLAVNANHSASGYGSSTYGVLYSAGSASGYLGISAEL